MIAAIAIACIAAFLGGIAYLLVCGPDEEDAPPDYDPADASEVGFG